MMKNYFAIGSNLQPTTMTSLRNLRPLPNATAAILPGYQLAFNIAGLPGIEPSAAAAHRCKDDDDSSSSSTSPCLLHGALYTLTESDFETLSLSEGVRPGSSDGAGVGYRWESCRVVPYVGDNQEAGATALQQAYRQDADGNGTLSLLRDDKTIQAYVLVKQEASTRLSKRRQPQRGRRRFPQYKDSFISNTEFYPPSRSYLKILQKGAAYWKLDRSYQMSLSRVTTAPFVDGLAGPLLQVAEWINPTTL